MTRAAGSSPGVPHSPYPPALPLPPQALQRASICALLAVIGAAVFAMTQSGGIDRIGAGVLAGAFLGGAIGLLTHRVVGLAMERDTQAAFQALIVGFALKAAGAILPWAMLSFVPQAQPLAHPIAYLIAFAVTILLVMFGGLFDHLRLSAEIAAKQLIAGADGDSSSNGSLPSAVSSAVSAAASPVGPSGSSHSLESAS